MAAIESAATGSDTGDQTQGISRTGSIPSEALPITTVVRWACAYLVKQRKRIKVMEARIRGGNWANRFAALACAASLCLCYQSVLGQPPPENDDGQVEWPALNQTDALGASPQREPMQTGPMQTGPMQTGPLRADAGLIEQSASASVPLGNPVPSGNSIPSGNSVTIASHGGATIAAQVTEASVDSPAHASPYEEIPPGIANGQTLSPADVIASVYRSFPEINQAREAARLAQGELTAARGAYDVKLKAASMSEPMGFYKNYRNALAVARRTWWGSELAAGYRIGRGVYEPWYLERETEKGGEFKLGLVTPLLQGRAIDEQRVAVFQASLARQAADPILQESILATSRDAMDAFWTWVAWGSIVQAQRELLELAETRGEQFQAGVAAGKFAEVDLILNQQQIAERRGKLLETERKFREAAFKLSLYLRDESGNPMLPLDQWLPDTFPTIEPLPPDGLDEAIALANNLRPEPRRLELEIRQIDLDRSIARNQILPRVDLIVEGSQDVGEPGSTSNNKGPFELLIGAQSEVPIQRRKALGKLQATSAKISQLQQKLRLMGDKIELEVRAAYNNLHYSAQIVEQSDLSFRAAVETLDRYRFAFDRGKIDLIYLNLLESKTNETEIKLIEAQQSWFMALAEFQAASGLDPLDQASLVSQLPASDRPGPGHLPEVELPQPAELDRDWERRTGNPEQP